MPKTGPPRFFARFGRRKIREAPRSKGERTGNGSVTRFDALAAYIAIRLAKIHQSQLTSEDGRTGAENPKAIVRARAKQRENIREAKEKWEELESLQRMEIKKRRSRFSEEELACRGKIVDRLRDDIKSWEEIIKGGAIHVTDKVKLDPQLMNRYKPTETDSITHSHASFWNDDQALKIEHTKIIKQIQDNDLNLEQELDELSKILDELKVIAEMQKDEVLVQNEQLNCCSDKIENLVSRSEKAKMQLDGFLDD
uniref:t-SNARE coiled-coil homology domain-containing protein n=1 Tax=Trieres chinensis TaxID=1514140 RepID=A0A7S2EM78_TRICV|mmetsp:Transcript_30323/g.61842  ORF Transcript_30323/g.61842 Transcript_30323/m.61842 type:complete len:254 (+) Transcript_30323:32-793(+)|eukprot:CAMPEP_0183300428 /NCGR_PEP_ID=MMETSP0160_2-20130417/6864_1 /TAXON_ID=2839 ORGANISM="Odontella Sinensis, Strain Grunow 1884" /NCGR_SAMPLE_ID=MMETSP0160_2 /ASSEMBLY_ACC=CAM_ASM_000250 /LENGTH=253 /DNA_ID=CAMNT_0025462849 /DNA_START=32 /DNA_END=793 /DNA_ORIENTATION=-